MTPEETKETEDMQNLNPQITDVEIGVRTLRKIKLYPLSVGDQMKMTAMIASTVSTFLVTQEAKDEALMVGFFVSTINDNLAKFLALAVGEKEGEGKGYPEGEIQFPETEEILGDTTNLQASEIAKIIYEMNYEESVKNFQSLFNQIKKLFPLERSLPGSVKDMVTDLEKSSESPSEKEDSQEDS